MENGREKRFIVDLDGCEVNTYGQAVCDAACELYGVSITPEKFTHYDFSVGTVLTPEQVTGIFNKPGYYRNLEPMPHAIEVTRELYNEGYEQHIITARPTTEGHRADTLMWLAEHRVPFDSLYIMAHHGNHDITANTKKNLARKLNAGYAIEDNPFNARSYAEICDIVFLVVNELNKNEPMPDNVIRIADFRDIKTFLAEKQVTDAIQTNKIGVKWA